MFAKGGVVFFVLWATVFYHSFDAVEISLAESNEFCENDFCLNKILNSSQEKPVDKKLNNLDEKEVYFVATTEASSDVPPKTNNFFETFQVTTPGDQQSFPDTTKKNYHSTDNTYQLFNTTEMTVGGVFTTKDTLKVTDSPAVTKTVSTSTTPAPIYPFVPQNLRKSKNICFCDIQTSQCDVNCCCDEDCGLSHFKVFTKCYDDDYIKHDPKYCYKNNFLFGNNTYYQMMKNNGDLFCIVRENVRLDLNYGTRQPLTTLEAFNKSLPSNSYSFSPKFLEKLEFIRKNYLAGSPVWSVQDNELVPFRIPYSSTGLLCDSEVNIKYLVDDVKTCFYQHQSTVRCESSKIENMLHHLSETKIIVNPSLLNVSQTANSSVICTESTCIDITCYLCEDDGVGNLDGCTKIQRNSRDISQINCWSALSGIQYRIWHNGSEGISKLEAYVWIRKFPSLSDEFLLQSITEVEYIWASSSKKVFRKSGNPGYLTGKPILAGRKVYNTVNDTTGKKEAIELSTDPKNWLSVLGSVKGICSSKERIPINFNENGQFTCSLKLNKGNFTKEKCFELQNNIFKLLIENEIIDETKENYFNKFVATFGNSRVEETGDWVQVLVDLFPISSSPVSFKSNHHQVICKNVITDLYVDIIYSKIGSYLAPQSKILGVSFQFGKHRDLIYNCDTSGCENTSLVQHVKLSTAVRFIDVTVQPIGAFAEPLSLETKLPHDFFYPFFSKSSRFQFLNTFVFICLLFVCFLNTCPQSCNTLKF